MEGSLSYAIVEELAGFGAAVHTCSRNSIEINERLEEWKAKGYQVIASVRDLASKQQREDLINTDTQYLPFLMPNSTSLTP